MRAWPFRMTEGVNYDGHWELLNSGPPLQGALVVQGREGGVLVDKSALKARCELPQVCHLYATYAVAL